jgi:predicted PurR-regulated permease PerM
MANLSTRPAGVPQAIIATAAAVGLLYFLRGILIPLVIAFVLTVLVDALVRSLRNRWERLPAWVVATLAGATIVMGIAVAIYVLALGGAQIVAQAPALFARVEGLLEQGGRAFGLSEPVRLTTLLNEISVPALAGHVLAGLQGLVSALFLVLVYFGFMLAERSRLPKKVRLIAGSLEHSTSIMKGTSRIAADIQTYVWVQTLTGFMLVSVSAVVMFAVGLENALFWTFVLFLLSFIPIIGVTVGSIAPALFALLQFPTIWQSLVVFISIQLAAAIVGNVVYPKMQAQTQNIGSVATLLALAFWSFLWGLPGAFLAVPMTLMLMMIFANFGSTRWIAVLLSNDGEPNFPTTLSSRPDGSDEG